MGSGSLEFLNKLENSVLNHHEFYRNSLPMIASENITSRFVRKFYTTDFGHRYAEGKVGKRFYQGCEFIDEVEELAINLTKNLFSAEHVNVQPISGVVANIAGFFALTNPSDLIMALSIPCGGHISHDKYSAAGIRGLRVMHYPFNNDEMEIDLDETAKIAKIEKPKLFVLGSSLILFNQPVKELSEIANEISASIMYDASHVLGLIAGKQFQNPLKEGADVVTGSTHKTFFGPQRAIILSTEELADKIDSAVFPGVVSNHHLNTLTAYTASAIEMLEFGEEYSKQVVKNARKLAESLYNLGFNVVGENRGFTETHQVAVDVSELGGGAKVAKKLEKINVVLNMNLLPWDSVKNTYNPSGIRMGVQEITRLGMKEDEMEEIAKIFYECLILDSDKDSLRNRVKELKSKFNKVKYTFEEEEAYTWNW